MGRVLSVAGATAAALVALAISSLVLGDESWLVPPPEAVAEGFVRQLATHRFRQTQHFLGQDARATLDPDRLSRWFDELERATGPIHAVDTESASRSGDAASAKVVVVGTLRSSALLIQLRRERGLWKVVVLPARDAYPEVHLCRCPAQGSRLTRASARIHWVFA
jgi:hypothetical protein